MDNFKFEEELTKVIGVNISLQYGSFFGASLNAMRLQVDTCLLYTSTPGLILQLGDRLPVVGEAKAIENVEKVLGLSLIHI